MHAENCRMHAKTDDAAQLNTMLSSRLIISPSFQLSSSDRTCIHWLSMLKQWGFVARDILDVDALVTLTGALVVHLPMYLD